MGFLGILSVCRPLSDVMLASWKWKTSLFYSSDTAGKGSLPSELSTLISNFFSYPTYNIYCTYIPHHKINGGGICCTFKGILGCIFQGRVGLMGQKIQ
jgi:hypothetical protein